MTTDRRDTTPVLELGRTRVRHDEQPERWSPKCREHGKDQRRA